MSAPRVSFIARILGLKPKPVIWEGTIRVPNSRTTISSVLPARSRQAYKTFLSEPRFQAPVHASLATTANLGLGLDCGLSGEYSLSGGIPHSPFGFDRCLVSDYPGNVSLISKGTGIRNPGTSYLKSNGIVDLSSGGGVHKPIDINPDAFDYDCHPIIGGATLPGSFSDITGAMKMLVWAHNMREPLGGMIFPLSVRELKAFPVLSGGEVSFHKGWKFFTDPGLMTRDQLLNMARAVENGSRSKRAAKAARKFADQVENGKRISRYLRWRIGRKYMQFTRPGVYEYLCEKGQFRIGHSYEQLITNDSGSLRNRLFEKGIIKSMDPHVPQAGLEEASTDQIKAFMDEHIGLCYALFDEIITLPFSTDHNLHCREGRERYLEEIYLLNQQAAQNISSKLAAEAGRQLGILHGAGGNAGGHIEVHRLGKIFITLRNDETGEVRDFMLATNGEIYPKIDENGHDLEGYKIIRMRAVQNRDFENYQKNNYGLAGGGSTRPDNLGFGLRDLCSIETTVEGTQLEENIISQYPQNIQGLKISSLLKYFHAKLIQQTDIDLLFAAKIRPEISSKAGYVFMEGSFPQLAKVLGGKKELFQIMEETFRQSYARYYSESRKRFSPGYFEEWDTSEDAPVLEFPGTSRENGTREFISGFLS